MSYSILLVEDDEILLRTYQSILEIDGYNVYAASDPYKALKLIENHNIHLAILDYNLPYMTGTQLGHLIKKTKENIKIMFISGNSKIHELVKDTKYEVCSVLIKPVSLEHLMRTLNYITKEIPEDEPCIGDNLEKVTIIKKL